MRCIVLLIVVGCFGRTGWWFWLIVPVGFAFGCGFVDVIVAWMCCMGVGFSAGSVVLIVLSLLLLWDLWFRVLILRLGFSCWM